MIALVFLGLICLWLFFVAIEPSTASKDSDYVDWINILFGDDE